MILLEEGPVLVINSLGDVRDELQVMLQLIFSIFQLGSRFPLVGLALLVPLLDLGDLAVELPDYALLLLLLQPAHPLLYRLDLPVDLLLHLLLNPLVLSLGIFDIAKTDSELSLEFIDPVAVLLLALVVSFLSAAQVLLDFLVLINLSIEKDRDLTKHLVPLN